VATLADVVNRVDVFLKGDYSTTKPRDVPDPGEVPLGRKGMEFEATALFIDVRQSTDIAEAFRRVTAAKMMKGYFAGAVKIIADNGGAVRSFNGDGMLAFFAGGRRTSPAVKSAMQIDWFVTNVLRDKFRRYFENNLAALGQALDFDIGCGIDDGLIYAVKVGIKGTNDVAWVGRATNTAAKLSNLGSGSHNIYITSNAYKRLTDDAKFASDGAHMWSDQAVLKLGGVNRYVRTSNYQWDLS
jgi:adenylate cyclase